MKTVAVPKESLDIILSKIPVDSLPSEIKHHWHRLNQGRSLEQEGYTPTVFGSETFAVSKKIKDWIAQHESEGHNISFEIGIVADERLSVYWLASRPNFFGGTTDYGCINLAGETFNFA